MLRVVRTFMICLVASFMCDCIVGCKELIFGCCELDLISERYISSYLSKAIEPGSS